MAIEGAARAARGGGRGYVASDFDETRLLAFLAETSDIVLVIDEAGRLLWASPSVDKVLGYPPGRLLGETVFDFVHPDDASATAAGFAEGLTNAGVRPPFRVRVLARDGSWHWVEAIANNLLEQPGIGAIVVTVRDINEQLLTENTLRATERHLGALLTKAPLILIAFNRQYEIEVAEGMGLLATGVTGPDIIGNNLADVFADRPDVIEHIEAVLAGEERDFLLELIDTVWDAHMMPLFEDGVVVGGLSVCTDFTKTLQSEKELTRLIATDGLTGLPSRDEFTTTLVARVAQARRTDEQVTVLFVDLDEFKLVNDSLGHAAGDELLRAVASRLAEVLRGDDIVARFASDEFVVMCSGGDQSLPLRIAERIAETIAAPVDISGETVFVSASIGVATTAPYDANILLRNADAAMYRAKQRGRARIEIYDDVLESEAHAELLLRGELRQALELDQFVLHYQPVLDLVSGRLDGAEALVRWIHPERGMVPPLHFIPAAEESGLIVELGAWVLATACAEAAKWAGDRHIAVNLSVRQLANRQIVQTVADVLAATGLAPGRLVLEVTESALMANAEMALGCLNELKALGVQLAIDDFGTGYSSLIYLKRMPVDLLKVDRSFVDGLGDDPEDSAIVESVISLAHAVGLKAVAEGVETTKHHLHLQRLGCDFGQGFLWSKPVPATDLVALFDADDGRRRLTG